MENGENGDGTRFPITGHTDETLSPSQMIAMFHLVHGTGLRGAQDLDDGDVTFAVKSTGARVSIVLCDFPLTYFPRDRETELSHDRDQQAFYSRNTRDESLGAPWLSSSHDQREAEILAATELDKVQQKSDIT